MICSAWNFRELKEIDFKSGLQNAKKKTRLNRARYFTTHYISVFFYHKHYLID